MLINWVEAGRWQQQSHKDEAEKSYEARRWMEGRLDEGGRDDGEEKQKQKKMGKEKE